MHALAKRALALVTISCIALAAAAAGAEGKHSLTISAAPPVVTIEPRNPRSNSVRLPSVEYVFEIRPQCADPFDAGSVSLTVADSRRTLSADDLEQDAASEIRLTVPSGQIAPVPLSDFCIAQESADAPTMTDGATALTIPAALSASASLLCVSDSEQTMTYASASLDVELVCNSDNGDDRDEDAVE